MNYKGRIIAFLLDLLFIILFVSSYYKTYGEIKYFECLGDIFSLCLAWWCGKQYDKANFLSEKDVLTEVYNRRYVLQIFSKMLAKVDKSREKLSVFVIDIDHFKKINDTYGHKMGDRVIQHISNTLLTNTRKNDVVARWGGDEFLVIAPNQDNMTSHSMLKRIENELDEISERMQIQISSSIGVAIYPDDAKSLDDLVKIADRNMYQIKDFKKRNDSAPNK
jgi:diguanylate cyclase (GGDEF)-like protein